VSQLRQLAQPHSWLRKGTEPIGVRCIFEIFLSVELWLIRLGFDMDLATLSILVDWAPYVLIFGGVVAVSRLLGFFMKGAAGKVLKILGFLGFFVGVMLVVTGVMAWLGNAWSLLAWVLLVLTGLGLSLKPLGRIPFSALLGLVAGLISAGLLHYYFPLPDSVLGISSLWIYLAVFLVPALIVFLIFKFVEDLAKFFGMILGSWPVLTVLGFLCMSEGILLLLNQSLLSLFG